MAVVPLGVPDSPRDDAQPSGRRRRKPPIPWVWLDGQFLPRDAPVFNLPDWLSALQASVSLCVCAYGTSARQFTSYYEVFAQHIELLRLPTPPYMSCDGLAQIICNLLNKNRYFGFTRITMVAFLQYRPDALLPVEYPTTSLFIYADPPRKGLYTHPDKGIFLGYNADYRRPCNRYSNVRRLGDPVFWDAGEVKLRKGLGDNLLLNESGNVVQSIQRTLYMVKEHSIYTPPLSDGVQHDPIRRFIPELVQRLNIYEVQERSLTKRDLLKADEVFLASTAYGIEGVTGIEGHRYTTYVAKSLVKHLNRLFFPDQQ